MSEGGERGAPRPIELAGQAVEDCPGEAGAVRDEAGEVGAGSGPGADQREGLVRGIDATGRNDLERLAELRACPPKVLERRREELRARESARALGEPRLRN